MSDLLHVLSKKSGLPIDDLLKLIQTAPRRYKEFEIPKRNGGMRLIAQPARELKLIQRIFVKEYLENLPVHHCAKAYRGGMSIRDNAAPHAGTSPILKLDFKEFFPSIRSEDWEEYCVRTKILSDKDIIRSSLILFRKPKDQRILRLSIGAPSSPILSNILLMPLDEFISSEAEKRGITYTRYADDMTFSGQRIGMLKDMVEVVRSATRKIKHPQLTLNDEKTTFITTAHRRVITGVTLANDGTLSLGRDKKRLLHARVHHASVGALTGEDLKQLAGELAFVKVVEPHFLTVLCAKYGAAVIKKIQSVPDIPSEPEQADD